MNLFLHPKNQGNIYEAIRKSYFQKRVSYAWKL